MEVEGRVPIALAKRWVPYMAPHEVTWSDLVAQRGRELISTYKNGICEYALPTEFGHLEALRMMRLRNLKQPIVPVTLGGRTREQHLDDQRIREESKAFLEYPVREIHVYNWETDQWIKVTSGEAVALCRKLGKYSPIDNQIHALILVNENDKWSSKEILI
jgi:hypothetical protein